MSYSNDRDDDVPKSEQQPAPDNVPESEQQPVSDDVPASEQQGYESAPGDWRELAKRPTKQLEREMRELRRIEDRHSYMAWLSVMAIIPRVRALKEKYGGDTFAARCKTLCRIGKTAAGNIVRWRIAEPQILNEIWETVHAEAHAASVRGVRYEYPTLNKMCLKYKPEEDDDVTDEVSEEDEEELRDVLTGARSEEETSNNPPPNDPRTKAEITKQNLMLEDQNKTLTRKQILLEQRLADRDTEIDQLSRRANDQRESLSQLRQLVTELKAGLAEKDAEIARLRAEAVTPTQPDPDPDPDPPPQASQPVPQPESPPEPPPISRPAEPSPPEPTPEPSEPFEPEPTSQEPSEPELYVRTLLLTCMRDVPEPSEYELNRCEQEWFIKPFRGGKISPERRMQARCNRVRAFKLLKQLLAWPGRDGAAKYLEKLTLRVWLRDDFEDLNLQTLLGLPTD